MANENEVLLTFAKQVAGLTGGTTWEDVKFYWDSDAEEETGTTVISATGGTYYSSKLFTFESREKDWGATGEYEEVSRYDMYNGAETGLYFDPDSGYNKWYYGDTFTAIFNVTMTEYPIPT
jgi:hypothetical protein